MEAAAVIEALSKLMWPILVVVVVWKLYPSIRTIIESRSFTIRVGETEITVQEATDQLSAQVEDLQKKVSDLRHQFKQQAEPVLTPTVAKAQGWRPIRRILWVDDNPDNNAYQISYLRDSGIEIRKALSTDGALEILLSGAFDADAVISDMGREERGEYYPTAGLKLIERAREANVRLPIFIHTTSRSASMYQEDVLATGGNGITSSPVELFEMIDTWDATALNPRGG
jgi:CheY-like chemotaxis protein